MLYVISKDFLLPSIIILSKKKQVKITSALKGLIPILKTPL